MSTEDESQAEERIAAYLQYARERPELFDKGGDGIRLLMDPRDIRAVEKTVGQALAARGVDPALARVGVVCRDPWFTVLRDAVEFPDGARRTHARIANVVGNGAAVLPLFDGQVALIRIFRHGPRLWQWEIPRGAIESGQDAGQAAHAEIEEEIGGCIGSIVPLGFVYGSTHFYRNGAHLFLARLTSFGAPQASEAIREVRLFPVPEVERMLREGEIQDSISVAAFLQARLRGLL